MTNPKLKPYEPSNSEVLSTFKAFLKTSNVSTGVSTTRFTTPAPSVSTEELIEMTQEVIDILERDGWIQGSYEHENHVCLVGAARKAAGCSSIRLAQYSPKVQAWVTEMTKFLGIDRKANSVETWNDTDGRTFDEVISKLRDFMYELKGR